MDIEGTYIILCCGANGRAIVFGRVESPPVKGEPVTLKDARMVLYWPSGGLFGLASKGPPAGTRMTDTIPSTTETVWQEWLECEAKAAEGLRAFAVYGG